MGRRTFSRFTLLFGKGCSCPMSAIATRLPESGRVGFLPNPDIPNYCAPRHGRQRARQNTDRKRERLHIGRGGRPSHSTVRLWEGG